MAQSTITLERRTSADEVFDHLSAQINTLKLLPGARISEVEIARQFDLSRQPVREAFIRLANRGLLLIRPQKATVVRRFSNEAIMRARFIRLSVETEVMRRACATGLGRFQPKLERAIESQQKAVGLGDVTRFHELDYDFHRLLCTAAGADFVFETITETKAQVDRLCLLSLGKPAAMEELIQDHITLIGALIARDEAKVDATIRHHLSRLDDVITGIRKSHADYFED